MPPWPAFAVLAHNVVGQGGKLDRIDSPPEWQAHHRNSDIDGGMHLDLDSIEFTPSWNAGWPSGQSGVVVGFEVASADEVDRLHDHLTELGYTSQQSPYDTFWGARYAIVADPDGNSVGLMSPIEPTRATTPPDPPSSVAWFASSPWATTKHTTTTLENHESIRSTTGRDDRG